MSQELKYDQYVQPELETIDQIFSEVARMQTVKVDRILTAKELFVTPECGLVMPGEEVTPLEKLMGKESESVPEMNISRNAYRQLMYWLDMGNVWKGMFEKGFPNVGQESSDFTNALLNTPLFTHYKNGKERNLLVRARGEIDGFDGDIRCVATEQYTLFDNIHYVGVAKNFADGLANTSANEYYDMLVKAWGPENVEVDEETLNNFNGGVGHRLYNVRLDYNRVAFDFVVPFGIRSPEGRGAQWPMFFGENYENKGGSTKSVPGMRSDWCHNTARRHVEIAERAEFIRKHNFFPVLYKKGAEVADMEYQLTKAIKHSIVYGSQLIEKSRKLALAALPSANDVVLGIIESMIPEDMQNAVAMQAGSDLGLGGRASALGVIDALTAGANTEGLSEEVSDKLTAIGGKALDTITDDMTTKKMEREFFRLAGAKFAMAEKE